MLIDELHIFLKAGHGGRGAVSFRNTKGARGPTGGNGGDGGSVYFEGVSDINALLNYASRKEIAAKDGENGKARLFDGAKSNDLTLPVPIGALITNETTGVVYDITKIGHRVCVLKGGFGGKGNWAHRSSVNTTPKQFQPGLPGEEGEFHIELKMIADVGLIGLPNAGKSSLLNALTRANSKVANYAFTTLEPSLGAYYELILADIPGLIEGASVGKGLGIKFLKHIERTTTLFHLISCETNDVVKDYETIRNELSSYGKLLAKKKEYVILTKSDAVSDETLRALLAALSARKIKPIVISLYDEETLAPVKKILNTLKSKKIGE